MKETNKWKLVILILIINWETRFTWTHTFQSYKKIPKFRNPTFLLLFFFSSLFTATNLWTRWILFRRCLRRWFYLPVTLSVDGCLSSLAIPVFLRDWSSAELGGGGRMCPATSAAAVEEETTAKSRRWRGRFTWTAPFPAPQTSSSNAFPPAPTTCAGTSISPSTPAATTVTKFELFSLILLFLLQFPLELLLIPLESLTQVGSNINHYRLISFVLVLN